MKIFRDFAVLSVLGTLLAACGGGGGGGGGGGSSSPPPAADTQPPAPTPTTPTPDPTPAPTPDPTPAPTPDPTPPPTTDPTPAPTPDPTPPDQTPPPAPTVPSLSANVINLDNHQTIGTVQQWPPDKDPTVGADTSTGGQGDAVDGLKCLSSMNETYHVHTHLSIIENDTDHQIIIPAQIGIVHPDGPGQCFYQIHTHDGSGIVHVEAAAPGTFTLGQFFDIWGRTLSDTEVGGITGMPIAVYVVDPDGVVTQVTDNWKDIELKAHRQITIQIGSQLTELPAYDWTFDTAP